MNDTKETTRRRMEAAMHYATEQLLRADLSPSDRERLEIQFRRANAWLKRNG